MELENEWQYNRYNLCKTGKCSKVIEIGMVMRPGFCQENLIIISRDLEDNI